ncbi:integrase [Candidatus Magnetomorum sp. HK-1]|nr:integrase [Candidatus Magnetomorum sp. HK-1]
MENERPMWIDKSKLKEIRDNIRCPYKLLNSLGISISKDTEHEIWCLSPFRNETKASFKIRKDELIWFDHGMNEGGGPLELIAKLNNVNIYKAGRLAVDYGLTSAIGLVNSIKPRPIQKKEVKKEKNIIELPKKYSLVPYLRPYHPVITQRGLSQVTCEKLRFGFLPMSSKSNLKGRIVFQIRGVKEVDSELKPTILTHIGRAISEKQETEGGKWRVYSGFEKKSALYNIDNVLLSSQVTSQVEKYGLVIVEGCFDVAKLYEAGIYNVVSTLTASLSDKQIDKIEFIQSKIKIPEIKIWFDNDEAGKMGTQKAIEKLKGFDIPFRPIEWNQLKSENKKDACDFSVDELKQFRQLGLI